MVYARKLGGSTLTFQVSGKLWRNSLIMQDRETNTWWSQVTGRAIRGPNMGSQLVKLESVETTWAKWRAAHPDTEVLAKSEELTASHYQSYFDNPERMGLFRAQWLTGKMPGKELVFGAAVGPHAVAVTDDGLESGLVQVDLGVSPVVMARGRDGGVRAFLARDGEVDLELTLDSRDGLAVDTAGSTWDLGSGRCIAGPRRGAVLEPVAVTPVYWFAWSGFYPNTQVID